MKIFDHEDQIGITLMVDFEVPRILKHDVSTHLYFIYNYLLIYRSDVTV